MTLEEFEALRQRAANTLGARVAVGISQHGKWYVLVYNGYSDRDLSSCTRGEAISHLEYLATPTKPASITITVPTEWAENYPALNGDLIRLFPVVAEACKEALKPYQS